MVFSPESLRKLGEAVADCGLVLRASFSSNSKALPTILFLSSSFRFLSFSSMMMS